MQLHFNPETSLEISYEEFLYLNSLRFWDLPFFSRIDDDNAEPVYPMDEKQQELTIAHIVAHRIRKVANNGK